MVFFENRRKIGISFLVVLGFVLSFFCSSKVQAVETNYALKPHYGANQIAENGQIDIFGNPGQTIQIAMDIANQSEKDQKYAVHFYTASTSDSGSYEYTSNSNLDSSMKLPPKNYVKPLTQVVLVKAKSIQTVQLNVTIPTQKFTGYLMGGVSVSPYKQKAKTSLTSNGTLIKNKYFQGVPVKIRQDRNNKKDPKFRVLKVVPTANKTLKTRGVNANVQNYVDGFVPDLNVKATVTKRPNDHKFKVTMNGNPQSIAPNSNYNLAIDWGKKPLQAGNYHLHMKYTTADKTKSWIVDKDFSISDADAAKYNKLSGIKPNYMWLWILIAILALLLVLGLGIYFGRRNQNKQQPMNNNMNNQR
ncbi:DUF3324 domain-containing protein [Bombilactobacillus bombi]|uniref:DUF3324 domain-containing protein n=1 Tax=Bombilactobacillus bombi TaxID=1303590 RepID=UPI0035EBE728